MDFLEMLDYCGYDVERAVEMAKRQNAIKEALDEIGLEEMESKSDVTVCGRLCCPRCCPCFRG